MKLRRRRDFHSSSQAKNFAAWFVALLGLRERHFSLKSGSGGR